ncbi:MAG: hypothetical protein WCE23_14230 [Candidatus Binatus sp.]|uniref:hypothetical protein n=1 Tax=Candidatus Binatus sp. TaxID=2811406 RepID=UPI003C7328A1
MTLKSERSSALDALVKEVLRRAHKAGRRELEAWRKPQRELRELARLDYVRAMRRTLDYHALRAIICETKKIWPQFNREQFRSKTPNQLAAISSDLRIHLQAAPCRGPEGMALRGFYMDKAPKVLKHPLIFLNTAHDRGAVSMTFTHEMGHHVTAKVTGHAGDGVHYFFNVGHRSHLGEPVELAADVIASLAAYPEPIARRIFTTPWDWGLVARADQLPDKAFAQIRKHVRELTGFDFVASLPPGQSFNYLTGMIHYAKLRWALLAEYEL